MDRARESLRSGDWLTRERIRIVATALLIAPAAAILFLVVTANGVIDRQGRPLGTDFSNVYAAGTYVLAGKPQAPFDPPQQFAREQALFGQSTQFYGWHYPPFFLFIAAALAWMPYGLALAVWQSVTLGLYLLVIRAILNGPSPERGGPDRQRGSGEGSVIAEQPSRTPTRQPAAVGLLLAAGGQEWLLLA